VWWWYKTKDEEHEEATNWTDSMMKSNGVTPNITRARALVEAMWRGEGPLLPSVEALKDIPEREETQLTMLKRILAIAAGVTAQFSALPDVQTPEQIRVVWSGTIRNTIEQYSEESWLAVEMDTYHPSLLNTEMLSLWQEGSIGSAWVIRKANSDFMKQSEHLLNEWILAKGSLDGSAEEVEVSFVSVHTQSPRNKLIKNCVQLTRKALCGAFGWREQSEEEDEEKEEEENQMEPKEKEAWKNFMEEEKRNKTHLMLPAQGIRDSYRRSAIQCLLLGLQIEMQNLKGVHRLGYSEEGRRSHAMLVSRCASNYVRMTRKKKPIAWCGQDHTFILDEDDLAKHETHAHFVREPNEIEDNSID
jgi:hypothetical protein